MVPWWCETEAKGKISLGSETALVLFSLYLQNSSSLKIITLISVIEFCNLTSQVYFSTNFQYNLVFLGFRKMCHYNFI